MFLQSLFAFYDIDIPERHILSSSLPTHPFPDQLLIELSSFGVCLMLLHNYITNHLISLCLGDVLSYLDAHDVFFWWGLFENLVRVLASCLHCIMSRISPLQLISSVWGDTFKIMKIFFSLKLSLIFSNRWWCFSDPVVAMVVAKL